MLAHLIPPESVLVVGRERVDDDGDGQGEDEDAAEGAETTLEKTRVRAQVQICSQKKKEKKNHLGQQSLPKFRSCRRSNLEMGRFAG